MSAPRLMITLEVKGLSNTKYSKTLKNCVNWPLENIVEELKSLDLERLVAGVKKKYSPEDWDEVVAQMGGSTSCQNTSKDDFVFIEPTEQEIEDYLKERNWDRIKYWWHAREDLRNQKNGKPPNCFSDWGIFWKTY